MLWGYFCEIYLSNLNSGLRGNLNKEGSLEGDASAWIMAGLEALKLANYVSKLLH